MSRTEQWDEAWQAAKKVAGRLAVDDITPESIDVSMVGGITVRTTWADFLWAANGIFEDAGLSVTEQVTTERRWRTITGRVDGVRTTIGASMDLPTPFERIESVTPLSALTDGAVR